MPDGLQVLRNQKNRKVKKQKMWVGKGGSVRKHNEMRGVDKADYVEVASSALLPKRHTKVVSILYLFLTKYTCNM